MLHFNNGIETFRKANSQEIISIVIAGDCCPWHTAIELIKAGKSIEILKNVKPVLDRADISFVQWETPLTNANTPINKSGPNLRCPPECVEFIKTAGFDVALLANNHIGDFNPASVLETMDILSKNGIKHVGAGKNLNEACKPLFFSYKGFSIGIINVAENEFGIAGENKPGSAPLEPLNNIRVIQQMADQSDITLVFVHGGNETNPVPSPRMVNTYRSFADAGASAVVNIHTHCPQGIELWNDVPIIYCPGNFFFPFPTRKYDPENFWWTGYLPTLSFDRKGAIAIEITPFRFNQKPCVIETFSDKPKNEFCQYLTKLSAIITDSVELQRYFDGWCAYLGPNHLSSIKNHIESWSMDYNDPNSTKKLLSLRNCFTCEAHNELMTNFLRMIEEFRVNESEKYISAIKFLQNANF